MTMNDAADMHDVLAEIAEIEPPTWPPAESLYRAGRRERRYKIMAGRAGCSPPSSRRWWA